MMHLVVIILNKFECLEELLVRFAEGGISGATVIESTGMARVLGGKDDLRIFGSLRMMFSPVREENRTIFTVLPEEKIPAVKQIVTDVVGDLSKPDTGIMFAVPVSFTEGIGGAE